MDTILEILLDATKDTLYLTPFLYLTYVVMEVLETKMGSKTEEKIKTSGKLGPIVGAVLGIIPQCGFSAVASTLYAGRVITRGTLIAVFLSTSDEMLPIFIAKEIPVNQILEILMIKFFIALIAGFIVDAILLALHKNSTSFKIQQLCEQVNCHCEDDKDNSKQNKVISVLKSSLKHTIQIILFVFVINLILSALMQLGGEEQLRNLASQNETTSVIITSLVGLIPNCGSSVLIADLWTEGIISFSSMLSGILVSSGIGLLVLIKTNKEPMRNFSIIVTLLAIGILCGFISTFIC